MIASAVTASVSVFTLGTYFYLEENICPEIDPSCSDGTDRDLVKKLAWIPLVTLITFVFGIAFGLGPIPIMLNGEIYSEEAKSKSTSIAIGTNWITTFLVTKFSTNLTLAINDSGTYFLYGSICFICAIFCTVVVPETKGKSLEDIREYFGGSRATDLSKENKAVHF